MSVAETAVRVVFEDSGSQVLISDSQGSISTVRSVLVHSTKNITGRNHNHSAQMEGPEMNSTKLVTKCKVSEATVSIPVTVGLNLEAKKATSIRKRVRPPLEMTKSGGMSTISISAQDTRSPPRYKSPNPPQDRSSFGYDVRRTNKENQGESEEIIPDTQFCTKKVTTLLPCPPERKKYDLRCLKERVNVSSGYISNKGEPSSKQKSNVKMKADCEHAGTHDNQHIQSSPAHFRELESKAKKSPQTKKLIIKNHVEKERISKPEALKRKENVTENEQSKMNATERSTKTIHQPGPPQSTAKPQRLPESSALKDSKRQKENTQEWNNLTRSLIKHISSKYTRTPVARKTKDVSLTKKNVNKSNLSANQDKNTRNTYKIPTAKREDCNDVYNYRFSANNDPTITLMLSADLVPEKMKTKSLVSKVNSTKENPKDVSKKGKKVKHPQKNLFSDTDTDRGADDTKTDISWLRESANNNKPQIVNYGRQKETKKQEKASKTNSTERTSKQFEKHKVTKKPADKSKNADKCDTKKHEKKYSKNETRKADKTRNINKKGHLPFPMKSPMASVDQLRSEHAHSDGESEGSCVILRKPSSPLCLSPSRKETPVKQLKETKYTNYQWTKSRDHSADRNTMSPTRTVGEEEDSSMSSLISMPSLTNFSLEQCVVSGTNANLSAGDTSAGHRMEEAENTHVLSQKFIKMQFKTQ
ncbi:hypothetical protein GDO86_014573, partial [Hymenochirus boettgeri]